MSEAKAHHSTSGIHLNLDSGESICTDNLKLMECVGHGTSGSVFRGRCVGCVGDVAIKTFRPNGSAKSTKEQQKMFLSEVEMLRRLRHPRLLRFLGACVGEDQILYIVTEYMPGGTIFELLHTEKAALMPVDRFRLALHVNEGVAYLHSQEPPVVHRDLKSPNIMVDKTPLGWTAKIIDYGLAESLMKTHVTLPPGKGVQGSAGYMSPECFVAPVRLTIKVDIWALGCILIEVFGGKPPHSDCENIPQVITKLVVKKKHPNIPCSLDSVGGAVDKRDTALKEIVEHCFEFDVRKRATATAVLGLLRRAAAERCICVETTE
jgi:serine/threonine protein kinase